MLGIDPKAARYAWTFAIVALMIYGAFRIRKTLLMFIIALMFAYLLYPLVEAIDRHLSAKRHTLAVVFPFLLILGLLVGLGWMIKPEIEQFKKAQQHPNVNAGNQHSNFKDKLAAMHEWGMPIGQKVVDYTSTRQVADMMPHFTNILAVAMRELEHVFIIPILSFLFLLEGPKIRDDLIELLFSADGGITISRESRGSMENVLKDAHFLILQYMRSLLLLCLATLISFTVALNWMGVQYATLLALFACLWEFVPLVGPLVSATAIILVSGLDASQQSRHPHLLWIIAFLGGYRIFQDYVLSPHLMKKGVKLHPLLVLFGVFAGGEIGGVGGIFLSVPILALVRLVYYEWRKRPAMAKPAGV